MKPTLALATLLFCSALDAAERRQIATGLMTPSAVAVGPGGKIFVTTAPKNGGDGAGAVVMIENGKAVPFAKGLDDPIGMVAFQQWLFVTDKQRVWRIDAKGKAEVYAAASAFPTLPRDLVGITVDIETGALYVSDLGGDNEPTYAIYRITPQRKVSLVVDAKSCPEIELPHGLAMDGQSHLLIADPLKNAVFRIKLSDGKSEKVTEQKSAFRLAWDHFGRLFISTVIEHKVYVVSRPGARPVLLAQGFESTYGMCLAPGGKELLVADAEGGTVSAVPISIPGHEVDEMPLPLHTEVAFPDLQWTGWKGETDTGKANPLRPIFLTHANDQSGRVFVATQHGVIHHFPNDQKATKTTVFLDIQDRVSYNDNQNEEGFLGLAFHPKFKDNGEFFVFYTTKKAKLTNVVSRFRVRKDDPSQADPDSEEQILEFKKPFWNHDGGTILFGPDGYLYITHGDGGAANDPYDNAQNMNRWLGKILRIDVDSPKRISKLKNYAVPKDNPFVGTNACPEIWAYGLRNVWRMAFDRKTGKLWAGDVGQNLFEEIDIIQKGGNYGWNRREGLHPFGAKGTGPRKEFIEPIWEYNHDVGKSITGGCVYRGPRLPELDGMYLHADYVTAKIWALKYDEAKGRVIANHPIKDRGLPIFSFGEDDKGEVYFLTPTTTGKGIYWFAK
jgi:glucose/arabinose dehydrogenase